MSKFKNICEINIQVPKLVTEEPILIQKIINFIEIGITNLNKSNFLDVFGDPKFLTRDAYVNLKFRLIGSEVPKSKDYTQELEESGQPVIDYLVNKNLVKQIGYIIEKVLIFDSYLNTLYTDPELNMLGVSHIKKWKFIKTGGELLNQFLFSEIGKLCPPESKPSRSSKAPIQSRPFSLASTSQEGGKNLELLGRMNKLCIMPSQTFDSYCILIQNKIINNPAIIVTAGTGLGKTVRVPIYLLEIFTKPGILNKFSIRNLTKTDTPNWRDSNIANLTPEYIDNDSMILCALPKNVLVRAQGRSKVIINSVRDRQDIQVKNNMFNNNKIIGYILKDDKKMMGQYLNFITAGFLNTKFKEDPKLEKFEYFNESGKSFKKKISCVVIDEAHERSLDIDILLKNLKKVAELRPNFKIVVMSATIKACLFREYFFGEALEYGNNLNEKCNQTSPISFENFNIGHVDMYIPIIHVEKDLTKLTDYYRGIGQELPNFDRSSIRSRDFRVKNCSSSEEIQVFLKYLKKTCINSNLLAGLLTHLITQIIIEGSEATGKQKYYDSLLSQEGAKSIGNNIESFFDSNITSNLLNVSKDIIIFVASKDDAKNVWMVLSNYGVFLNYDCFYFEASNVSVLRPFGSDEKKKQYGVTYWCEEIIPRKSLPHRWPKDKPAWLNYNLEESEKINNNDTRGRPQIIIATNAIESSITFENCGVVIDNGLDLSKGYLSNMNMDTLSLQPIVKSSANQRKGRTGRKASGLCYRLYTKAVYNNMLESKKADILSENLDFEFIKILDNGDNFLNFDFIESPSYNQINITINRLIKANIIPKDFSIYTAIEDLDRSYIDRISEFNKIAQACTIKKDYLIDPIYFELDLPAIFIWYKTKDSNLKLLMAYFIWLINRPKSLESKFEWGKTKGEADNLDTNPICSLLGLWNGNLSPQKDLKKMYRENFIEWVRNFDNLDNFKIKIDNLDSDLKLNLLPESFKEMNYILNDFNQICKFGYWENSSGENKIYFDTQIGNEVVFKRKLNQNNICYYFANKYFNGQFKFMFLNVETPSP